MTDQASRVKSYTIYEMTTDGRKKKGTSAGSEFVIKDFPAEGRHWFSVVSVNDLNTESSEMKVLYDAGYKIILKGMCAYVYLMGTMSELADCGYGGLLEAGVSADRWSLGLVTGIISFSCGENVSSMMMLPFILEWGYRFSPFNDFYFIPVIKTGFSYDIIEYVSNDPANPLIETTSRSSSKDPVIGTGIRAGYDVYEKISIFSGLDYSMIYSKDSMNYLQFTFGAVIIF